MTRYPRQHNSPRSPHATTSPVAGWITLTSVWGSFPFNRIIRQRLRNDGAGFGLPKDDGHIRPDALFDLLHQVDWHRSATSTDTRERCEIMRREVRVLQHGQQHGGDRYQRGAAFLTDDLQGFQWIEGEQSMHS